MRQIKWISLAMAIAAAAVLASPTVGSGYAQGAPVGSGRAYATLGDLPVKHRDRVKPLSSMAIEEARLIYGTATIKLLGPDGKRAPSWEPVAALVGWSARPEFWDNQDFILVECQPLNRLLRGASIRSQVRSMAGDEAPEVRKTLQALAAQPELTEAELRTAAQELGAASATGKSLSALADEAGKDHQWLAPRVLENAQIQLEGRTLSFAQWAHEIQDKKDRARSEGTWATPMLTSIEENAALVGERFFHYQAIRDHKTYVIKPLDVSVVPRLREEVYRKYSTEAFEKGMKPDQTLSPLEANVAYVLTDYLQVLEAKNWHLPGEDGAFDQEFAQWIDDYSAWVPVGLLLNNDDSELIRAGFPIEQVRALRKSYRDLEDAERAAPGHLPEAVAIAVLAAARDLGSGLGGYPKPAAMARESQLNQFAPFSKAPIAHGVALALLLLSFGITANPRTAPKKLGAAIYGLGMAGLSVGIGLELYGFFVEYRILGGVPVRNMCQTVIWVALATSLLGLAMELLWRKKYAALAATSIALLATVLAENVWCLDSRIHVALPLSLRNRWLVGHVLTVVSSYAAFALALGLGLLAVGHYLTATYRRSPTFRELAWPLYSGAPLFVLGRLGVDASYRALPLAVVDPWLLFYLCGGLAAVGGVLSIVGGFSLLGELANRSPRRAFVLGLLLTALTSAGLIAGTTGAILGPLARAFTSYDVWLVGFVGGALTMMSLLGLDGREGIARIEPLAKFINGAMLAGILLLAVGTILGGAWARYAWAGPWARDPKLVWALITLVVYLVPLFGRFAGFLSTFGFVSASVVCFMAVLMSWFGLNFVLRAGLHTYGFTEGGDGRIVMACALALLAFVGATAWRRSRSHLGEAASPAPTEATDELDLVSTGG